MSLCEKKLPNDKYDICNGNIIIHFYSRGFFFISTVQYLYIYFPKKMSKHKNLSILNGAKLGDATVARATPLLCPPQNFMV